MNKQNNQNENQQKTKKLSKNQVYYQKHTNIIKAKNVCNLYISYFIKYNKIKYINNIKHKKTI